MFPINVYLCKYGKHSDQLTDMAAVGHLEFCLSHLLRNYFVDLNETWSECSFNLPSCASTENNSDSLTTMAAVGHFEFSLLSHLLKNQCADLNETWSEFSLQCLVVQVLKIIPIRQQTLSPSASLDFPCYRISSETVSQIRTKLVYYVRLNF